MRLFYGFLGVVCTLAFVLYPVFAVSFSTGAPPGFNGAPGGNGDCTACHNSFEVNSGTGSVSMDLPDTFMPGETITFTVSVDNTTEPLPDTDPRQGFEVSVQDPDENDVGTLVIADDVNTQFADGEGLYVTHTTEGNQLDTWDVQWTAPEEDDAPDEVIFYVAGNAGNGGNGNSGDYIYTTSETVKKVTVANEDEAAPLAARLAAVYPNPFAATATVAFTTERAGPVTVTLYDGLGRTVQTLADGPRAAGEHALPVVADGLPAGVYFVEVRTADGSDVRPVTLVR